MSSLRIICRSSRLSLAQAAIVKQKLLAKNSSLHIEIVSKDTTGDLDLLTPLYEMEGRDFFTKEIDTYLFSGQADIAVHSLKDLSAERANDEKFYSAIVERIDPRDVAIFSTSAIEKLKRNEKLLIGTSSLRRQELAPLFLQKSLPFYNLKAAQLESKPIRGNVDSRLAQLQAGKFDGLILAAAGLNRLLQSDAQQYTKELLLGTKIMWLPLIECTPAPGQGALLAEALSANKIAVDALRSIHQTDTADLLNAERKAIESFGGGCHQRYGAIALNYKDLHLIAIAGKDEKGKDVTDLLFNTSFLLNGKQLFSTTDFMSSFFSYEFSESPVSIEQQVVFVAHHRAVTDALVNTLKSKRVWCSGTKTWQDLAAKGIWCEGCADGFGFSFLSDVFKTPLVSIEADEIHILTNKQSAQTWKDIHVTVSSTYGLVPNISEVVKEKLQKADAVFWTNFQQYEASQSFLKKEVLHICAAGKTAELLIQCGIRPIVFPSIKTFNTWRKKNIG